MSLSFPSDRSGQPLPSAWRLIGAVNAARPAAGPLFPFQQFGAGSLNATLSRRWLFRVIDPANELIPTERRQAFPQHQDFRIRSHCCLKVFTCFVDSALGKSDHHETSHQPRERRRATPPVNQTSSSAKQKRPVAVTS